MPERLSGQVFIVLAALAWSTAGVFVGALGSTDGWTVLFWRSLFAVLMVPSIALAQSERKFGYPAFGVTFVAATGFSTVGMVAFIPALQMTSVANVAMIHASLPLISALAAILVLAEAPGWATIVLAICAFIGASIIFAGSAVSGTGTAGNWLALLMTASMACMTVALRADTSVSVAWMVTVSNGAAAGLAAAFAPDLAISGRQAMILAAFAFIQMAVGLVLYSKGARILPSADVALLSLLEAPLSPLWVWLVFDQQPSPGSLAGGAIILCAATVFVVQQPRARRTDRE